MCLCEAAGEIRNIKLSLLLTTVLPLFQMSAVGITENVKGDIKKFEVWYNGREEVYIIQVHVHKLSALKLNCFHLNY